MAAASSGGVLPAQPASGAGWQPWAQKRAARRHVKLQKMAAAAAATVASQAHCDHHPGPVGEDVPPPRAAWRSLDEDTVLGVCVPDWSSIRQTGMAPQDESGRQRSVTTPAELTVKNTFIHVHDYDAYDEPPQRRVASAPAEGIFYDECPQEVLPGLRAAHHSSTVAEVRSLGTDGGRITTPLVGLLITPRSGPMVVGIASPERGGDTGPSIPLPSAYRTTSVGT